MIPALDPAAIRALTARLVGCRSISPDVPGETRCAREIEAALPDSVERGEWKTPDGRPAVWAFVPGRTTATVVLLGHYDTVGVGEYAALGDPAGEAIAFDPASLRVRLLERLAAGAPLFSTAQTADLRAERARPGTWMFGRGALDMKSGVAVGLSVLAAWSAREPRFDCGLLFVATPDEENESAGMIAALGGLRRLRDRRGLDLLGVLNLDTVAEPAGYVGMMGKVELGCYVIGRPTHAGEPLHGVDAAELAAGIVTRVVRSQAMVDSGADSAAIPPVALRLRDLKDEYNIQTAREAWVEFNLITRSRPLAATLEILRAEVIAALHELLASHASLAEALAPGADHGLPEVDVAASVMTYAELCDRAGTAAADADADADAVGTRDPRAATLARLRERARRTGLGGPAVVLFLLPPFYPHAAPGDGPLIRAAREVLGGERDLGVRDYYSLVSDACYAAWRAEPLAEIERQMPSLGREYALPYDDASALDLDVLNLGPWGHDLHGLLERVNAEWTFERLPGLVWKVLEKVSDFAATRGTSR